MLPMVLVQNISDLAGLVVSEIPPMVGGQTSLCSADKKKLAEEAVV